MRASTSVLLLVVGCLWAAPCLAGQQSHRRYFLRDSLQEQYLKAQSDPDTKLTPARVWRMMKGLRSHPVKQTPSATEFQPTVDSANGNYKLIAALTFKFY